MIISDKRPVLTKQLGDAHLLYICRLYGRCMTKRSNTDRPIGAYLAELARDARHSALPRRLPVGTGRPSPMKVPAAGNSSPNEPSAYRLATELT